MKLFCFGFGYSAAAWAERLSAAPRPPVEPADASVAGTRTRPDGTEGVALAAFDGSQPGAGVPALLDGTTHVLISIPPGLEGCPTLLHHGADIAARSDIAWIGYLSTIGVYGDAKGAWVDEETPARPQTERALRRWQAEQAWRMFGRETGKRVQIFRLPGIYGPGRSVLDTLRAGTARRIVKPGQVFNRIHVEDIAATLEAAAARAGSPFDVYNIADDAPCPPEDVVAFGAELLGLPIPEAVPYDAARLSPMAASFYGEVKRVSNARIKSALGVRLLYPTYREGLTAIAQAGA